jgi:hypothetical protein
MLTRPAENGALIWNVNDAMPLARPMTRSARRHDWRTANRRFIPSALKFVLSPLMPRRPGCGDALLPRLRARVAEQQAHLCVAAGWNAGRGVCDIHAECSPLSAAGGGAEPPPPLLPPPPTMLDPVLKSHSFVSHVPATVMSKAHVVCRVRSERTLWNDHW